MKKTNKIAIAEVYFKASISLKEDSGATTKKPKNTHKCRLSPAPVPPKLSITSGMRSPITIR